MNIVTIDPVFLLPEDQTKLRNLGNFTPYNTIPSSEEEKLKRIQDADVVINFWTNMDADLIKSATNLKLICAASAGCEWIDVQAAQGEGIIVCDCPGHNGQSVAEYTINLMLNAIRHTKMILKDIADKKFDPAGHQGIELRGRTLGLVGYGEVGKRVAEIAEKGFGMNVMFINSKSSRADLEKLLKQSDIISIHTPITPQTEKLIGAPEFSLMKENVVFINSGRGKVIDEEALIANLKSGKIYAAGLDVLATEPFDWSNELFTFDNVIITPHAAWNTVETDERLSHQIVEIVEGFVKGEPVYVIPEHTS